MLYEVITDKYGLRELIRFNSKVLSADFDEGAHLWRLESGTIE